ncbi:MAG: D-tyrosyl-tRNA(Tyr) deacylase [Anaerolineales bacterium]|nr:D-tyrosyl-tRNA(Tyr) deacylase [Anaerolineales bacterium]
MKIVFQRVRRGAVSISGKRIAEIGRGAVLLVGVGQGDTTSEAEWLAKKCAELRVFEDEDGRMNRSLVDISGEAIVVSQFTLCADVRKGRRPSFVQAAAPDIAAPLVDSFAQNLEAYGIPVQTGQFGGNMLVEIENDGPVTILLERATETPTFS